MEKSYKIRCSNCQALAINGRATHETPNCGGVIQYIDSRGRTFVRYTVWSLDVLGNARDGFEVNDRSRAGTVMVPIDASDKRLIQELKKADLLNKRCRFSSFTIDGDETSLMIDAAKTGEPIYQLEIE